MKKSEPEEQDILYILRRPDGSIRAELPMTASMAAKINASRRKRGFFDGDWEPQPNKEYGLWHLDPKVMPDWMFALLKKAQQDGKRVDSKANPVD